MCEEFFSCEVSLPRIDCTDLNLSSLSPKPHAWLVVCVAWATAGVRAACAGDVETDDSVGLVVWSWYLQSEWGGFEIFFCSEFLYVPMDVHQDRTCSVVQAAFHHQCEELVLHAP